eukprot:GHVH01006370.1.p1 GENE.GHVH01006370.1~~GHVH01006370.1.p1  ORF type:complete len:227 (+),score=29.98 GHVH01006370.1:26-682(+)
MNNFEPMEGGSVLAIVKKFEEIIRNQRLSLLNDVGCSQIIQQKLAADTINFTTADSPSENDCDSKTTRIRVKNKRPKDYTLQEKEALKNLAFTIANCTKNDFAVLNAGLQEMDPIELQKLYDGYAMHCELFELLAERFESLKNIDVTSILTSPSQCEDLLLELKKADTEEQRDIILAAIHKRKKLYGKLNNLEISLAASHLGQVHEKNHENKHSTALK